jgi:hypothetical protein
LQSIFLDWQCFLSVCFTLEDSINIANAHDQGIDLLRGGRQQAVVVQPPLLNVLAKEGS